MINMDIQELLAKAFDIGNKTSYNVNFYKNVEFVEKKQMTYTELGMFLIKNNESIDLIDIYQKNILKDNNLEKKWLSCKNYLPNEVICMTYQCKECSLYREKSK